MRRIGMPDWEDKRALRSKLKGARVPSPLPSPVPSTGGNEGLLVCLGTKCVALITLVAGVAISTRAMMGSIANMCNLLDVYKPSADTDFTQSVDELVVSHRRGNRHLPQHLLDLLCTTQEYQM